MSTQTEGRATGDSRARPRRRARDRPPPRVGRGSATSGGSSPSGVAAGVVLGALYSVSGGSLYEATARIAPGPGVQPGRQQRRPDLPARTWTPINDDRDLGDDDPGGRGEGRHARRRSSAGTSRPSGVTPEGGEPTNARSTVLVEITVRLNKKKRAEDAANAIAEIVKRDDDVALRPGSRSRATQTRINELQRAAQDAPAADRRRSTRRSKQPGLSLNEQLAARDPARPGAGGPGPDDRLADDDAAAADPGRGRRADADHPGGKGREDDRALPPHLDPRRRPDRLIGGAIAAIIVDRRAHRAAAA